MLYHFNKRGGRDRLNDVINVRSLIEAYFFQSSIIIIIASLKRFLFHRSSQKLSDMRSLYEHALQVGIILVPYRLNDP